MIEFVKISKFPRKTLYNQLVDAYSIYDGSIQAWNDDWLKYDEYFYDNLDNIADKFGFITVLDDKPIGHISWDPRNKDYAIIGYNCIVSEYKGNGYGKMQLVEALRRIKEYGFKKAIVTTNGLFLAAQKNYESVGFKKVRERVNNDTPFSLNYIDYEILIK